MVYRKGKPVMKESCSRYEMNLKHRNTMIVPLLFAYVVYSIFNMLFFKRED